MKKYIVVVREVDFISFSRRRNSELITDALQEFQNFIKENKLEEPEIGWKLSNEKCSNVIKITMTFEFGNVEDFTLFKLRFG